MVRWSRFLNATQDEFDPLLPTERDTQPEEVSAREVTKIAVRLKYQLEQVIPCELDIESIVTPLSTVITSKVVETAKQAGGEKHKGCVVFCLLVCLKWFRKQALRELWDADLHHGRAVACEVIAKRIIESEEDVAYLLEHVMLKRFSILVDGEDSTPVNAVEKAVDLHALRVIGSSGYQKCISYLWRGWLVQDEQDPTRFVSYDQKTNASYWAHLEPDRMRVPRYQNAVEIIISLIYLGLYTGAINTINPTGDLDVVEIILYLFTLGFILDELSKLYKVGWFYLSFWTIFNNTMYALLTCSFVTRMIALAHTDDEIRSRFNHLSYNFLAFTAPMFWIRILLYLDTFRFFGTMLVVIKIMMRESLIFFALLFVLIIGFYQAFLGMDLVDQNIDAANFIATAMANAVMSSPDFSGFDNFAPPFGIILYYIFAFLVMVILLNILIALYGSAYSDITDNATDEFMALFSQKCLAFVRAPDENVFIAPFNLIELLCLVAPFEWWMSKATYERLNDVVMGVIYAPLLVFTAFLEQRDALIVRDNRRKGEEDEDTVEEWEQLEDEFKVEEHDESWTRAVRESSPDVRSDPVLKEMRALRNELDQLKAKIGKSE